MIKDIINKIIARIRLAKIKHYTPRTVSEKFHDYADKIEALEKFYDKYCTYTTTRTSVISKNLRAYYKEKNKIKKEILIELYNF